MRSLHIEGSNRPTSTSNNKVGFSELLHTFPLVNNITVGDPECRLNTGPRLLLDSATNNTSATLHIHLSLTGDWPKPAALDRINIKLRGFRCEVDYSVHISASYPIDWDLSTWGRLIIPGSTKLRLRPTGTAEYPRDIPFCAIYNRPIRSMIIDEVIDLGLLSQHLEQRRQMGWEEVKEWDVCVTSLSHLPKFLGLNRHTVTIKVKKSEDLPFNIGGFLCLDWSAMRRTPEEHRLQHLEVTLDFSKPCTTDIEARLRRNIEAHQSHAPFFDLKTLTIRLSNDDIGIKSFTALPPFSQIAKLLVQLGGAGYQLNIERMPEDWLPCDYEDWPIRCCIRSQLMKEVKLRQELERSKATKDWI